MRKNRTKGGEHMNETLNDVINRAMEQGYISVGELQQHLQVGSIEYERIVNKLREEDVDIVLEPEIYASPIETVDEHEVDTEITSFSRANDSLTAYVNDIKYFPLLTADEEYHLAVDIAQGKEAKRYLELHKDHMTPEEIQMYEDTIDRGDASRDYFTNCNLRLVVWWSSKYRNKGMPQEDLIQEGNMGLMKAVEKFEPNKGTRFSTYASNWIRKSIIRAIQNQARTVRLPVHISAYISKLKKIERTLEAELGRAPTIEEMADEMNEKPERIKEIQGYMSDKVSLDILVGAEEATSLGDMICDTNTKNAFEEVVHSQYREELSRILSELSPKEYQVVIQRFGMDDGTTKTLEEIGKGLGLTRERVRQIEAKALRKLRHPTRSDTLKQYLEW